MEKFKVGDVLISSNTSGRVGKKILIKEIDNTGIIDYEILEVHSGFETFGFVGRRFLTSQYYMEQEYKKDSPQINPHMKQVCYHNWKEEYYFSAKPFKTCTKCQARYEDT